MEESINILLIEDNAADSRLIYIYLKEMYLHKASLTLADSLSAGLEHIKNNNFDIIVIDLSLPDSSGIDTFKSVFAASPERPIIVLTGLEDELIGMNTVKLGAQDFLIKGKLGADALKRSIDYSIQRFKLLKELSENTKKLEERTADLLREKQKLAQAQKLAHIGSWEWVVGENTITASEELLNILEIESDKLKIAYDAFIDFIHPDDRENVTRTIDQSIKNFQPFDFFHRIVTQTGKTREIHTRGELVVSEQDAAIRIAGTEQDITVRKKEEELEQLAMVAIKSYNAVIIANKDGKIEWVNDGFTKLTGYKLEDVKGTYGEILRRGKNTGLSPETDLYKIIRRDKKPLSYENKNFAKDGTQYWVLTSLTPILDEKGEVNKIISIDSDISKQKRAEQELILANDIAEMSIENGNMALEELHKAKELLEESLKVKERFLANMSHEIRTPMNAIIGFTNLMLKSDLPEEQKQYLNAIHTSGENLLVIINDILDISKMASGKITFETIPFNLKQLMATLVELMRPKVTEKNLALQVRLNADVSENLVGDPTRLNQILTNLLDNAIKFTNEGKIKIKVSAITNSKNKTELQFEVSDTGIGIPPDSLERVFESFTQASDDTSRKFGGTGLGLAITRQLIDLLGGKISVKSTLNKGTTFVFNLAFKKSARVARNQIKKQQKDSLEFPLKGTKVLLVEDNTFNQMLATKMLERWKCVVDIAENGKIAVKKARQKKFDLILMDIQLPEMDGYETTHTIRNHISPKKRNTPIIALTAHAFASEAEKCREATMNGYISKPFTENTLFTKMMQILQASR
ncbi:MAG: response regulator [Bacteroidetes bacterium]|nr:response regulator [Bacteroidota bacterium]